MKPIVSSVFVQVHLQRFDEGILTRRVPWLKMRAIGHNREVTMHRPLITLVLVLALTSSLAAQEQKAKVKKAPPERPTPTVADYVYAKDHERQKFDFWQAKSDKPTPVVLLIHGGGWVNGD